MSVRRKKSCEGGFCKYFTLVKPTGKPDLHKVNVTITLGPRLAAAGKAHAIEQEMSFSELVSLLLRRELAGSSMPSAPPATRNTDI